MRRRHPAPRDVDPVQAFRELPPLPEAARMRVHLTCTGDPHRYMTIPSLMLRAANLLRHPDPDHERTTP